MYLDRATFLKGAGASIVALSTPVRQPSAYVFCRPGGALSLGNVFGHVGWAYRDGDGWMCGAIEMAHNDPSPKGKDLWYAHVSDPFERMGAHDNVHVGVETRYDLYKPLYGGGNARKARAAIAQLVPWRFAAPGHDCLDAVRLVLEAFGIRFNDLEKRTVNPNAFFGMLAGKPQPLNTPWPGATIDVSLYDAYDRYGLRDDILATAKQAVIFDDDISYDPHANRPQIAWSSFVVRRGAMVVYNKPSFEGAYSAIVPLATIDMKTFPWTYKELGSYVVATHPFDPAQPPIAGLKPRFGSREERSNYYRELQSKPYGE